MTEIAKATAKELSLISDELNLLNEAQVAQLLKRTPKKFTRTRPAKGGGEWTYVSGSYMKKVLNIMFGFNWSFEILDKQKFGDEMVVHGRLTVKTPKGEVIKEQFGNKDIIYKKQRDNEGNRVPLSLGNDLKAAATDALKKCAAEIGIAADIYGQVDEFRELEVVTAADVLKEVKDLYELKKDRLDPADVEYIDDIIDNQREISYNKVLTKLRGL